MGRQLQDVTDAELRVLEVLWDRGPTTIREIRDRLYPDATASKAATVLKLLERLERKQFVCRDHGQEAQVFHVLVDRDGFVGGQLRRIAERLGGNSLTPLLTHLVQSASLTDQERSRLRELLDAEDRFGPRKTDSDSGDHPQRPFL